MVLSFECVDGILKYDLQIKAIEQCIPVLVFFVLCKVVLTFECVDEILKCGQIWAVLEVLS